MTDEDFRAMLKQRIDSLEKEINTGCGQIRERITSNHEFSEKQIDAVYNDIRQLHKKVDGHNRYIMMLVGACLFVTALVPVVAVVLAKFMK